METGKAKGVRFDKKRDRWCATIKHVGKTIYVGQFVNQNDAIEARQLKMNELGITADRNIRLVDRQRFEKQVCDDYQSGDTYETIGHRYNLNPSCIGDILKKHNIPARDKFVKTDDDQIVKLYNKGLTIREISDVISTKVDPMTIASRLKSRGVKIRHRKYVFDTSMFKKVDSEYKAYLLGLLYADGGIGKTNVILGLHEKDRPVLLKLSLSIFGKDVLKLVPGFTMTKKNGKSYTCAPKYSLILNSKELVADLSKLGCMPRKSLTLQFPAEGIVPSTLMHHFVRGYFDGDGWISPCKKSSTTTYGIISSNDFCQGFQRFLSAELNINASIRPCGKVSRITFSRREDIQKIYEYMYRNATIYMTRKKDVFDVRLH